LRGSGGLWENRRPMARWPIQRMRDRHYAMLRAAYEGLSNEAIARAFHVHRWTVGNLLNSPSARQVLSEWHSAAHRLALDHPLRTLIAYYARRQHVRLLEGSVERRRQLDAAARARQALAHKRLQRAQPAVASSSADGSPPPPRSPSESPEAFAPVPLESSDVDRQQVARVLKTIAALNERDEQERRAREQRGERHGVGGGRGAGGLPPRQEADRAAAKTGRSQRDRRARRTGAPASDGETRITFHLRPEVRG
jgi:hypothetical protein